MREASSWKRRMGKFVNNGDSILLHFFFSANNGTASPAALSVVFVAVMDARNMEICLHFSGSRTGTDCVVPAGTNPDAIYSDR